MDGYQKRTSVFVRIIAVLQIAVQAPFSLLRTEIAPLTGLKVVKIVYIDLVVPNKLLVCILLFSVTHAQPWSWAVLIISTLMLHNAKLNASMWMSDSTFVPALFVCGVGLFIFFTVRALIHISDHIFVQTREGSLYSWWQVNPVLASQVWPGLGRWQNIQSLCPQDVTKQQPLHFWGLTEENVPFPAENKHTPILLTKSSCWLRFTKIPEVHVLQNPAPVRKDFIPTL